MKTFIVFFRILLLIIGLNLFIINNLLSQAYFETPKKIKGGFSKCIIYSYKYKNGILVAKSKQKDEQYKYDVEGNLIEKIDFFKGSVTYRTIYRYNDNKKIMEEITYNADGTAYDNTTCEYDDNWNVIKMVKPYGDFIIYKYIERGNKIEQIEYSSGAIPNKNTFIYDEKGYLIEQDGYNNDGSKWVVFSYKYDNNGNIIETKGSEKFGRIFNYKYDDKRNKIETTTTNIADTSIIYKESYQYDIYGNMIELINYNNNKPTRKIKYVFSK